MRHRERVIGTRGEAGKGHRLPKGQVEILLRTNRGGQPRQVAHPVQKPRDRSGLDVMRNLSCTAGGGEQVGAGEEARKSRW